MADPKTPPPNPAAQAEAAAAADAAKREEEQRRQAGMADWFKNLLPDFSLGGIFEMLIFAAIVYFVAKTDMGQNLLKWATDKLDPDMQATVLGFMNKIGIDIDMGPALEKMDHATFHAKLAGQASPEVLDIIDPNDGNTTLKSFLDIVRKENGGKVTMNGFTSAGTITRLIIEKPEMAKDLIVAMRKPGADGKANATAQEVTATIASIIKGPQLDVLLNPENRAKTIMVLGAALPNTLPMNETGLTTIINQGIDANGKPNAGLRQLFIDALDPDKQINLQADLANVVGVTNLLMLADPKKIKNETARYAVNNLQQKPAAKAALDTLIAGLGDQGPLLANALQTGNMGTALGQLLLQKENIHLLPQAVALMDQLPELNKHMPLEQAQQMEQLRQRLTPANIPAIIAIVNNGVNPITLASNFTTNGKFSIDGAIDMLLQPIVRHDLKQAATANVAVLVSGENPFLTKRNIDAIIAFGDTLDTSNNANNRAVVRALAKIANTPVKEALKGLTGGQLAAFFSVPANRNALSALLDPKTGIVGSTPEMQAELALLRKDFSKAPSVGLGVILSDEQSAQFLLDNAGNKGTGLMPEFVERGAMRMMGGSALGNSENQDIILELGKVLNASNATQANTPAPALPAPTTQPAKRSQQPAH